MKKMILLLSVISSMSLFGCSHFGHGGCGKSTCKMEKENCGKENCDKEKMKAGCPDCDDKKKEEKKDETKK